MLIILSTISGVKSSLRSSDPIEKLSRLTYMFWPEYILLFFMLVYFFINSITVF